MSAGDPHVEVQDGDIVVTLPYTHYTVTYYKPAKSPQLLAKRFSGKDDPNAPITKGPSLAPGSSPTTRRGSLVDCVRESGAGTPPRKAGITAK